MLQLQSFPIYMIPYDVVLAKFDLFTKINFPICLLWFFQLQNGKHENSKIFDRETVSF